MPLDMRRDDERSVRRAKAERLDFLAVLLARLFFGMLIGVGLSLAAMAWWQSYWVFCLTTISMIAAAIWGSTFYSWVKELFRMLAWLWP